MVGFGDFLHRVGNQYGAQGEGLQYDRLKALLEEAAVGQRRGYEHSEGESSEGGERVAELASGGVSVVTPTLPPTPPTRPLCTSDAFLDSLEEEVTRVNAVVKRKLRSLHRVRKALDVSRALRGTGQSRQDQSIALMQLSNVYDDVIIVLWFMYLNSIAVSKIVKKYNKNVPNKPYTVDPSRWLFLRAGMVHVQKAKAAIETEFASCVDSAVSDSERILVQRNQEVQEMAEGIRELVREQKHHLFVQADPTEWAVAVDLTTKPKEKKEKQVLQQYDQVIDDVVLRRRFELLGVAGRGAYGVVHRARHRTSNNTVAIKTIYDAWSHPVLGQRTYREILIMQELRHPNIVPLNDIIVNGNKRDVHLVMPFISHTLEDLLAQRQLLLQHKKWFMLQLTSALSYMHARGVVHRDLKLSNILIDDTPKLFLSDFGLARTLSAGASTTVSDNPDYVQTQWYRAPEVLLCSRQATPASDMWSVGCILAELLTGVPLFPGQDDQHQLELILGTCPVPDNSELHEYMEKKPCKRATRRHTFIPKRHLADVLDACWKSGVQEDFEREGVLGLLSDMMQFEPRSRPHAHDVLRHPWLQDTSFPWHLTEETKVAARPLCGEADVILDLSCTQLHHIGEYRAAVTGSPKLHFMRKCQDVRIDMNESAAFIQRIWRWKKLGGERPRLRKTNLIQKKRTARLSSTASCTSSVASTKKSLHKRRSTTLSNTSFRANPLYEEQACAMCALM